MGFRIRSCGSVSRICHLLAVWPLNLREPQFPHLEDGGIGTADLPGGGCGGADQTVKARTPGSSRGKEALVTGDDFCRGKPRISAGELLTALTLVCIS